MYVELADQYKDIDPVSNVAKRNVLAEHLREVIDILEQKVRLMRTHITGMILTSTAITGRPNRFLVRPSYLQRQAGARVCSP